MAEQNQTTGWRPMVEHCFPWDVRCVIIVAFARDEPSQIDVFRARVGEHGAFFDWSGSWLSLHEQGWVPFAWREDDTPARDDNSWPPMWNDYLTEAARG